MKFITPFAAGLALALASVAHAQVSCSDVRDLNDYALDDFLDITEDKIKDELYETSFWLDDLAEECNVDLEFDSVYGCIWVFDTEAAASAAYHSQRSMIGSCLSGWTTEPMTPSASATNGYRTLQGLYYGGTGEYLDIEWSVSLEEHTSADGTDWHVWVTASYLWL